MANGRANGTYLSIVPWLLLNGGSSYSHREFFFVKHQNLRISKIILLNWTLLVREPVNHIGKVPGRLLRKVLSKDRPGRAAWFCHKVMHGSTHISVQTVETSHSSLGQFVHELASQLPMSKPNGDIDLAVHRLSCLVSIKMHNGKLEAFSDDFRLWKRQPKKPVITTMIVQSTAFFILWWKYFSVTKRN